MVHELRSRSRWSSFERENILRNEIVVWRCRDNLSQKGKIGKGRPKASHDEETCKAIMIL